jgi:hypothetical protein
MSRKLLLVMTAVASGLWCDSVRATEVFQGRVLAAGNQRITIEKQNTGLLIFQLASNASLTRDGKKVRLEELKKTDRATVTTDNRMLAIIVEVRSGSLPTRPPRIASPGAGKPDSVRRDLVQNDRADGAVRSAAIARDLVNRQPTPGDEAVAGLEQIGGRRRNY